MWPHDFFMGLSLIIWYTCISLSSNLFWYQLIVFIKCLVCHPYHHYFLHHQEFNLEWTPKAKVKYLCWIISYETVCGAMRDDWSWANLHLCQQLFIDDHTSFLACIWTMMFLVTRRLYDEYIDQWHHPPCIGRMLIKTSMAFSGRFLEFFKIFTVNTHITEH